MKYVEIVKKIYQNDLKKSRFDVIMYLARKLA